MTLLVFVVLLCWVLADPGPSVLDGSVTPGLHDWAHRHPPVWHFFGAVTHAGEAIARSLLYLGLVVLCVMRRRVAAAWWVGISGLGYPMLSSLVKLAVDRPRPDGADPSLTFQETSFPSGHSGSAMVMGVVLAGVIAMSLRGWSRALALALAAAVPLLIGLSRLMLGVHYVSDVLGGFSLAFAWCAAVAWAVGRAWGRPRRDPVVQ